jgi:hypothetical protein
LRSLVLVRFQSTLHLSVSSLRKAVAIESIRKQPGLLRETTQCSNCHCIQEKPRPHGENSVGNKFLWSPYNYTPCGHGPTIPCSCATSE